jgi:mannose-1-phosphate guanylyltransferase
LWAVVPAGGAGTRLWPLSRAAAPKFLLDLTGSGRTLLQQTVDRLAPLVGDRVVVVTGARHRDAVVAQLPDMPAERVLAEPSARDSMAAIGLAAAILEVEDPDAILGSFAADHVIGEAETFRACLTEAAAVAATGRIVTIGIEPTHPSTGFGYLRQGDRLDGFPTARAVSSFTEKPDAEVAAAYVASGEYRWNGGMFVAPAGLLLDELAREHPELARGLRDIAADRTRLDAIWPSLTKIAIDHAVAEPAAARGLVATVPGSFGWDDVGDFASLADLLPGEAAVRVLGRRDLVVTHEGSGLVVPNDRHIAVVGLDDVVVVDTGDAVLVTDRAHAQDVKRIVAALQESGREHLT